MDWFKIGEGVQQGYIFNSAYLTYMANYIIRNAGLDESQTGMKTAGININILRYADDTTEIAESEEELKNLLMWVKENEKAGLKFNIQKIKILAFVLTTSW